jgi:hypothetical protein
MNYLLILGWSNATRTWIALENMRIFISGRLNPF